MRKLGKGVAFSGCDLLAESPEGGVEDVGVGRGWPRRMRVYKSCPSRRRDWRTRWAHRPGEYSLSEKREERRAVDWEFRKDAMLRSSGKAK